MLEALFLDGLVRMVVVKWTWGSALHIHLSSKFTRIEWAATWHWKSSQWQSCMPPQTSGRPSHQQVPLKQQRFPMIFCKSISLYFCMLFLAVF